MKKRVRVFKNISDITFNKINSNIFFVTGLSGSGKSYFAREYASNNNYEVFQLEWLIHYKHCSELFKTFLDTFIDKYHLKEYVDNKWNNEKIEDNNKELRKYINLLLKEFMDTYKDNNYIVEGIQLFTLIDYNLISDYYIVIKGTSSVNSLKNRIKRDYQKRKDYKFIDKVKWFIKVIKQSKLYQFNHRKKLNKFISYLQASKSGEINEVR